jgi:hypothetical protein
VKELQNHCVSAWTVDDLTQVLTIAANPFEIPRSSNLDSSPTGSTICSGNAGTAAAKRVRLIAQTIVRTVRAAQASYGGTPAEAPHINEETAMLLVNQYLAAQRSAATCGRDDVRAAIEYLANPLVRLVVRDPDDHSIVVTAN